MIRFEAELRKRLQEEAERLADTILSGKLADYVQYRDYCARLAVVRKVLGEFIDDVNTAVNKG